MSKINYDEQGFLIGKQINLGDVQDTLRDIHDELMDISALMAHGVAESINAVRAIRDIGTTATRHTALVNGGTKNINRVVVNTSNVTSSTRNGNNIKAISYPSVKPVNGVGSGLGGGKTNPTSTAKRGNDGRFVSGDRISAGDGAISTPKTAKRGKDGRFVSGDRASAGDGAISTPKTAKRGNDGRFVSGDRASAGDGAISKLGTKISSAGSGIVTAISGLNHNADEASPDIKALGEVVGVVAPLGRGLKGVFGSVSSGGISRGQDRWYKRFFRMFDAKNRHDEKKDKRELQLLKNIEKKDFSFKKGGIWGFLIAAISMLAAVLAGVLGGALKAIGFKKLGDSIGSLSKGFKAVAAPLPTTNKGKDKKNRGKTTPADHKNEDSGKAKEKPKGKIGSKIGSRLARGMGKVPLVGTLITAGLLANDIYSSERDTSTTRQQKNINTSKAVGSGVGVLGGAALGAAIGSVVPGLGTVIGGLIGSLIGGLSGGAIGDILGGKFGKWVNTLQEEHVATKLVRSWDVHISAISILWKDFTSAARSSWDSFTTSLSQGWEKVRDISLSAWDSVASGFTSVSDYAGSVWDNIKTNFTAVADSAIGIFKGVSTTFSVVLGFVKDSWVTVIDGFLSFVKDKLHIDLSAQFQSIKDSLSSWWSGAKNSVGIVNVGVKRIADYFSTVGERANAAADEIESNRAAKNGYTQGGMTGNERLTGLNIKSAESTAGGQTKDATADFAQLVSKELGVQLNRFTAFNDKFHAGKHSKHAHGEAFDFTINGGAKASKEVEKKVYDLAEREGFDIRVLNEYMNKSKDFTAPHMHVSVNGKKKNAAVSAGLNTGYTASQSGGLKLGERNHNMGNLVYAGQKNAVKDTNSAFAVFKTDQDGMNALYKQLQLYNSRKINTVRGIISKYAPPNENNTERYIAVVSKKLGVTPDQPLNLNDPVVAKTLMQSIVTVEQGRNRYSASMYDNAISGSGALSSIGNANVSDVSDVPDVSNAGALGGMMGSIDSMMKYISGYNGMAVFQSSLLKALSAPQGVKAENASLGSIPKINTPKASAVTNISQAPAVTMPLSTSPQKQGNPIENLSRDLSDSRIAHIVTGGYFRD